MCFHGNTQARRECWVYFSITLGLFPWYRVSLTWAGTKQTARRPHQSSCLHLPQHWHLWPHLYIYASARIWTQILTLVWQVLLIHWAIFAAGSGQSWLPNHSWSLHIQHWGPSQFLECCWGCTDFHKGNTWSGNQEIELFHYKHKATCLIFSWTFQWFQSPSWAKWSVVCVCVCVWSLLY